uniref:Uncharacterized protein n=1 Tax=Globisporangium ultimum (strain ATCC 200006 / CBS 805.95 / DAOM BR144) TaxID=431595 RepID=K3WUY1_GLOUD
MQKHQELLEKQEEAKLDGENPADDKTTAGAPGAKSTVSSPRSAAVAAAKKPTLIQRKKAKLHVQIRKAKAIARKRIPVQLRILTEVHSLHFSPLQG